MLCEGCEAAPATLHCGACALTFFCQACDMHGRVKKFRDHPVQSLAEMRVRHRLAALANEGLGDLLVRAAGEKFGLTLPASLFEAGLVDALNGADPRDALVRLIVDAPPRGVAAEGTPAEGASKAEGAPMDDEGEVKKGGELGGTEQNPRMETKVHDGEAGKPRASEAAGAAEVATAAAGKAVRTGPIGRERRVGDDVEVVTLPFGVAFVPGSTIGEGHLEGTVRGGDTDHEEEVGEGTTSRSVVIPFPFGVAIVHHSPRRTSEDGAGDDAGGGDTDGEADSAADDGGLHGGGGTQSGTHGGPHGGGLLASGEAEEDNAKKSSPVRTLATVDSVPSDDSVFSDDSMASDGTSPSTDSTTIGLPTKASTSPASKWGRIRSVVVKEKKGRVDASSVTQCLRDIARMRTTRDAANALAALQSQHRNGDGDGDGDSDEEDSGGSGDSGEDGDGEVAHSDEEDAEEAAAAEEEAALAVAIAAEEEESFLDDAKDMLRHALRNHTDQATQRQTARVEARTAARLRLASRSASRSASRPGSSPGRVEPLDPVVLRKLGDPATPLSLEDSRACIVSCIEHGKVQARRAAGNDVVVVLGNTGAGKSSFINLLHGCTFELDPLLDRMAVSPDSPVPELMTVGHSNQSETFAPQVEAAGGHGWSSWGSGGDGGGWGGGGGGEGGGNGRVGGEGGEEGENAETPKGGGENAVFADCPGFLDNRGFEINIANAVNVKQALAAAASARVVVIINYHSLKADRGKGVKDLFHILSGLFGTANNVKRHAKSLILAISQAPISHPETGAPMSLDDHRARLLDPSGLDHTASELLAAIGGEASVIMYHLLGRGDESWLRRDDIIARIRELAPIEGGSDRVGGEDEEDAGKWQEGQAGQREGDGQEGEQQDGQGLFRSAIDDADKESLRCLVRGLGDAVSGAIFRGTYDDAADMVNDMLELKVVESGFVTSIVDRIVDKATRDGRGEQGVDEKDGGIDSGEGGEKKEMEGGEVEEGEKSTTETKETRVVEEGAANGTANDADEVRRELRKMALVLIAFAGIEQVREKLIEDIIAATCNLERGVKRGAEEAGRKDVDEALREVAREVGDSPPREVLALPAAITAMRETQRGDVGKLQARHLKESEALRAMEEAIRFCLETDEDHRQNDAQRTERREEITDRHATERRLAAYRRLAADEAWAAHRKRAVRSMGRYDATLLAEGGAAFRTRVGLIGSAPGDGDGKEGDADGDRDGEESEVQRCLTGQVDWNRKKLSPLDCEVMGAELRALARGGKDTCTGLLMSGNALGDDGVWALATATAFGALPVLTKLYADNNACGDVGFRELARQMGSTSTKRRGSSGNGVYEGDDLTFARTPTFTFGGSLTLLDMGRNEIGDEGMTAFAKAVRRGGVRELKTLYLHSNRIGNAGAISFAAALSSSSSSSSSMLDGGKEGDKEEDGDGGDNGDGGGDGDGDGDGRGVLVEVLPKLEKLWLNRNQIGNKGVEAVRGALVGGALRALKQITFEMNPGSNAAQQACVDVVKERAEEAGMMVGDGVDRSGTATLRARFAETGNIAPQ